MNAISMTPTPPKVVYPDSDGQPMAENTLQFQWIVTIQGVLDAQYAAAADVFVAGDLLWYPVEGEPTIRQAPDTLVVFGRPKGYRGSYRQWEEDNIPPQVVWEVLSPGNRPMPMLKKFEFYQKYGVEEYYVYDPDNAELFGWLRKGDKLLEIPQIQGWVSPRLKVKLDLVEGELVITGADGKKFLTYVELAQERTKVERERQLAFDTADKLRAQLRAAGIEPKD